MPRQTSVQLTEATKQQVAYLQEQGFGTFTDIVRIAIDRMHTQEVAVFKICKHCGRAIDQRVRDIELHEAECKEWQREVAQRNIERVNQGKRPTRNGF